MHCTHTETPTASVGMCFNVSLKEQEHSSDTILVGPSVELMSILSLKTTDKAHSGSF